ncbi:YdcF family protein [bacterium]|nr:MAG: YdcF family protein [bacterium]
MTKRKKKRILLGASILLGVPVVWSIGMAIAIVHAGSPNPGARADVAIVLGAAVWDKKPSPVFAARIDHAIWLFKRGQVKRLFFTGGRAKEDRLSEAEAARDYALAKGVPQSAIRLETTSTSTYQNLSNANRIMRPLGVRTAVIVSDPYHSLRAGMIAGQIGIAHDLSPTPTSRYKSFGTKAGQLLRETYFATRFLLTGN